MSTTGFVNAMINAGVDPGSTPIIPDGLIHRYRGPGDKPGRENCWYKLFDHGGAFGSYRLGIREKWLNGAGKLSREDRQHLNEQIKAAQIEAAVELKRRRAEVAAKAQRLFNVAYKIPDTGDLFPDYLFHKGIKPHRVRRLQKLIVIPIYDCFSGELISLQFVGPTGRKRFLSGGRTRGGYYPLVDDAVADGLACVGVAEGFATAASVYEASGIPVAVAFDANNLVTVAKGLREKHPAADIILFADNDSKTDPNPGLTHARAAAAAVQGKLAVPEFPVGIDGTDFNDLASRVSLKVVKQQIDAAVKGLALEPEAPGPLTDIGLSNEFVNVGAGADFRYVPEFNRWYEYQSKSGRWKEDRMRIYTMVRRFLTTTAQKIVEDAEEQASKGTDGGLTVEQASDVARSLTNKTKVHNVVDMTRCHGRVAMEHQQFDADPYMLNTPAGAVDLRTGHMRPARREDYFTKTTPGPARDEPTPIFDRFMLDVMGWQVEPADCQCAACVASKSKTDDERLFLHRLEVERLVEYQLRVYGQALTGDVSEQKLFLQKGEGGNGKGTLNDFMSQYIFGKQPDGYATEIPIEALLESRNEQHPTALMQLWHARLALARESEENSRWNEGRVKRLTGGDAITARYMRQDFVTFNPTHTLIVFVNDMPILRGADQAAWKRRLQLGNFPQLWADQEDKPKGVLKRDPQMVEKLAKEAAGVLFKLIQAGGKWYNEKTLAAPATVLQASDQYLVQQSAIRAFIDDESYCDRSNPNETVTVNELYGAYQRWCEKNREAFTARHNFPAALERAGVKITRTGGQRGICRGLKLKAWTQP